jgi:hypothetical protein
MKHQKTLLALVLLASAAVTGTAQAALINRGNGLIYDDDQNITWTGNANINGLMTWAQAVSWADSLVYGGYSDWRLPTTSPAVAGFNQTGSEMGHLFYTELGGSAFAAISSSHNANYNLFSNIQDYVYWSGTEYAPNPNGAWGFGTFNGVQNGSVKDNQFNAWAVRSGDVSAVPVPETFWLLGGGLMGLLGLRRRGNIG